MALTVPVPVCERIAESPIKVRLPASVAPLSIRSTPCAVVPVSAQPPPMTYQLRVKVMACEK